MNISFSLARSSLVKIIIYSRSGQPRRILVDDVIVEAGNQVFSWDGRDHDNDLLPPALYIVCIEASGENLTQVVQIGNN